MVRSLWIGTLATALSCTAPGWGQVLQQDRWIMVREEGKPAVKCRVVSTTKQPDGSTVCKALTATGETITLLQEVMPNSPNSGTVRMRIVQADKPVTTSAGPVLSSYQVQAPAGSTPTTWRQTSATTPATTPPTAAPGVAPAVATTQSGPGLPDLPAAGTTQRTIAPVVQARVEPAHEVRPSLIGLLFGPAKHEKETPRVVTTSMPGQVGTTTTPGKVVTTTNLPSGDTRPAGVTGFVVSTNNSAGLATSSITPAVTPPSMTSPPSLTQAKKDSSAESPSSVRGFFGLAQGDKSRNAKTVVGTTGAAQPWPAAASALMTSSAVASEARLQCKLENSGSGRPLLSRLFGSDQAEPVKVAPKSETTTLVKDGKGKKTDAEDKKTEVKDSKDKKTGDITAVASTTSPSDTTPTITPAVVAPSANTPAGITPAVVDGKKKESPTEGRPLFTRLFGSAKAEQATPSGKEAADKKTATASGVVNASSKETASGSSSRPILPLASAPTEDPLSRPDIYSQVPVTPPVAGVANSNIVEPPAVFTTNSMPAPAAPTVGPSLFGKIFGPPEPRVSTAAVTVTTVPGSTAQPAEGVKPGILDRILGGPSTSRVVPAGATASGPREVDNVGLIARLRGIPAPRPEMASTRSGVLPGTGSIVAANDRGIMGQSRAGVMVRTPGGTPTYLPSDQAAEGASSVPVSATNAFTMSMPAGGPGMVGGMPMVAMQAPQVYDQGVPEGAANAFTMASTSRPIPADFGPPGQIPNAFEMEGGMGGAYTRPAVAYYPGMQGQGYPGGGYPSTAVPMQRPSGAIVAVLRGSIMPSQRELAAEALARVDWHVEPEVVAALVTSARTDPAPMVRLSCVRALGQMKVATPQVFEAYQEIKADQDVRVRRAVEQILTSMTAH